MLVYYLNLVLVFINKFILKVSKEKKSVITIVVMMLFSYVLIAFREPSVGVDTIRYIQLFIRTKQYGFFDFSYSRFEYGYLLLNKALSFIDNPQIFIAIVALLTISLFAMFIFKESKIMWLSVYLFITLDFYTITFNLMRQALALSIVAYSYKYLKSKQFLKFLVTILVASTFHISALIVLPIYIFKNFKMKIKNISIYLLIVAILLAFPTPIINFLLNIFSNIEYETVSTGGWVMMLTLLVVFIFGLIFMKTTLKNDKNSIILYNFMIFAILMQILTLDFGLLARITIYFRFFMIIFIPEILYNVKDKYTKYIGIIAVLIFATIQYILTLNSDLSGIVPYMFNF